MLLNLFFFNQPRQSELLIPAAIIVAGDKVPEGQLIEAVALPWFEIIKGLERDPNFLHQVDWRMMEELIAGAYMVEVTDRGQTRLG
jgi:hypothetical protein